MLNNDDWAPVPGYENEYEISKTGEVFGLKRQKMKSSRTTTRSAYLYIKAYKDNKMKALSVHRMVAMAFISNPDNLPQVNHLDGNKQNNCVDNLEWVSCSDNHQHAFKTGLRSADDHAKKMVGTKWGKTSKYRNVTWDPSRNKWKGAMKHKGKMLPQKRFKTEVEAARYVNQLIEEHQLIRPKNIII